MKTSLSISFFLALTTSALTQSNPHIEGIYCSDKIRKGISCVSLSSDHTVYYILISSGSFNTVIRESYMIKGDTIKIPGLMDFYWQDKALYWLDKDYKVMLEGGLEKADDRLIKRIKKKYEAVLKDHNICFKNGLLEQCD